MLSGLTDIRYLGAAPGMVQQDIGRLYVEMNELQVYNQVTYTTTARPLYVWPDAEIQEHGPNRSA
jgi:hypothetical protein